MYQFLAEVFRINDTEYSELQMNCVYFPHESVAKWTWQDPENSFTLRFDIPQCVGRCLENPPHLNNTHKNRTSVVSTFLNIKIISFILSIFFYLSVAPIIFYLAL